jgi:hypothetical protein
VIRFASEALAVVIIYGAVIILVEGPGKFIDVAMMLRDTTHRVTVTGGSPNSNLG